MSRVGSFFAEGLQDFVPEEGRYDIIWCQWVLSHLTDGELRTLRQWGNTVKHAPSLQVTWWPSFAAVWQAWWMGG